MEKADRGKGFTFLTLVGEQFNIIFQFIDLSRNTVLGGSGNAKNHS